MKNNQMSGHVSALVTIMIWGTTFISTKVLLADFQPIEILFVRFLLGLLALMLVYPRPLKVKSARQEGLFALAGFCGVCMYYLLENIALTYTMASNVGVITSLAPVFTAVLAHIFVKAEERLKPNFIVGFLVAISGICLISFNGARLELNPIGDLLAITAALFWAVYSLLTKNISEYGYNTIQTTRRVFMYGLLFMLPALPFFKVDWNFAKYVRMDYLLNLLFLGLGASALCFVTWNFAVKLLGAVRTSIYIYMVPVITVVFSALLLHERVTPIGGLGTLLTLAGLFLSEGKWSFSRKSVNP